MTWSYNALLESQNQFVNPIQQQCNGTLRKVQLTQAEDKVRFQGKELCMLRLHGTSITDRCTLQFYCFPSHSFMKIWNQIRTLQLLHQYAERLMVSAVVFREWSVQTSWVYVTWVCCTAQCFAIVKVLNQAIITTVSLFNIQWAVIEWQRIRLWILVILLAEGTAGRDLTLPELAGRDNLIMIKFM